MSAARIVCVLLALTACERGAKSDARWWCTEVTCFATRTQCSFLVGKTPDGRCDPAEIAYCVDGCRTVDGAPSCGQWCSPTLDICEVGAEGGTCAKRTPPAQPELFADYSAKGWWCSDLPTLLGVMAVCQKYKQRCEWDLDAHLAKAGVTRTTVPGHAGRLECTPATSPPWCVSFEQGGSPVFWCTRDRTTCDLMIGLIPGMKASSDAGGYPVTLPATPRCERWAYD